MKQQRLTGWLILVSTIVSLTLIWAGSASPSVTAQPQKVKVIVSFYQPPGLPEEQLIRNLGGTIRHRYSFVPALAALMPEDSLYRLRVHPRVQAMEMDTRAQALEQTVPWGLVRLRADLVHPANKGAGVKVAILDSGIDLNHEDLVVMGNVSFVDGAATGNDDFGHGTKVAGVVAARDNGIGTLGVAPEVALYAVKVMDEYGRVLWSDAQRGLDWAMQNNMQVVNMSFGSINAPPTSFQKAIERAYRKGLVLVAGAGNKGELGIEDSVVYPAKYPEVIAAGATDETNTRVSNSSYGPSLELVAPGVNIYTTTIGSYGYAGNTSIASPHVAGTAALLIASGITNNEQVRQKMRQTAVDLGVAGRDNEYAYGLVDAYAAVKP